MIEIVMTFNSNFLEKIEFNSINFFAARCSCIRTKSWKSVPRFYIKWNCKETL